MTSIKQSVSRNHVLDKNGADIHSDVNFGLSKHPCKVQGSRKIALLESRRRYLKHFWNLMDMLWECSHFGPYCSECPLTLHLKDAWPNSSKFCLITGFARGWGRRGNFGNREGASWDTKKPKAVMLPPPPLPARRARECKSSCEQLSVCHQPVDLSDHSALIPFVHHLLLLYGVLQICCTEGYTGIVFLHR